MLILLTIPSNLLTPDQRKYLASGLQNCDSKTWLLATPTRDSHIQWTSSSKNTLKIKQKWFKNTGGPCGWWGFIHMGIWRESPLKEMVIKDRQSLVKAHSPGNTKEKPSKRNGHERWVVLFEGFIHMGIWKESLQKEMLMKTGGPFWWAHSHGNIKGKPSGGPWWGFIHMGIWRESFQKEMVIKDKWSMVRVHSHGNMKGKLSERNGHKRQVVLGEGSFTWEYERKAFRKKWS